MNLIEKITRYKQSALKITDEKNFYFDPFMMEIEPQDGDYVLITHGHGDHYSPADIKKIAKEGTVFIAPADVAAQMETDGFVNVRSVLPGDVISLGNVCVEVLPAYNLDKDFHPKSNNWVGYILRFDAGSFYIPGDTDGTPEFEAAEADLFLVPVGGTYTMDVPEAIKSVNVAKPKFAVPYHYATLEGVGSPEDGQRFADGLDADIKGIVI